MEILLNNLIQLENFNAPRSARLSKEDKLWTQTYMAIVSPEGIGANILGRRWYDQYVVSGRNVDDLVIWIGFLGPASFYEKSKSYELDMPYRNLQITQDGKVYKLTPKCINLYHFIMLLMLLILLNRAYFIFLKHKIWTQLKWNYNI